MISVIIFNKESKMRITVEFDKDNKPKEWCYFSKNFITKKFRYLTSFIPLDKDDYLRKEFDFLPDIENTAFLDGPDYNWKVIKAFKQKKYTVANILYPDWNIFEKNGFELLPNKPKNTFYHFVMIRRNF